MSVKLFLRDEAKQNPHKMMAATEYKLCRVMTTPYDMSLMDSNWIHDPLGQNGGAATKMVLKIGTILMIAYDSNFSWT
jgi:hypothetical protein